MYKSIFSVTLAIGLLFSMAGEAIIPKSSPRQSNSFSDWDKGFSITFPAHWNIQRDFMGLDIFAAAPDKTPHLGSVANMSVISKKLDADYTIDNFFASEVEQLKRALLDFELVETGQAAFDGFMGKRIIYNDQFQGDVKVRTMQYFVVHDGHGIIITCSAEKDEFPKYADLFDKTTKTLKVH